MVEDKEQRIETLQDRVDELEATVSKMLPSRRDALKLGAAGAVGAVGMAGSASAQNSNQVGTIGTDSDRVDVNAEDIDAVSVNTEQLSTEIVSKTISSGAIDITSSSYVRVGGEGGAEDTLDTVNGGSSGDILIITPASGEVITIADVAGNIRTNGDTDKVLDGTTDRIMLQYDGLNSLWVQLSFSDT